MITVMPSKSVMVPMLVPCILTVAPMIGFLARSVTVPVMPWADVWANGLNPSNRTKSTSTRFENGLDFIVIMF